MQKIETDTRSPTHLRFGRAGGSFRASKIRQGKLSGLIHNSENHRDVDFCSVSVYFKKIVDNGSDEDSYETVPGSEVVVKREARKDNSSTYYYNGKKLVFKELAVLLRELGIDLDHNRFLILQVHARALHLPSHHNSVVLAAVALL